MFDLTLTYAIRDAVTGKLHLRMSTSALCVVEMEAERLIKNGTATMLNVIENNAERGTSDVMSTVTENGIKRHG